jgi:hypothetical protein
MTIWGMSIICFLPLTFQLILLIAGIIGCICDE